MIKDGVIFLGPSKFEDNDGILENYLVRPPAKKGDIAEICETRVDVIILIDGLMIQDYPPTPREIYHALKKGKKIYGCSSLGALRAVELNSFGMVGSGWVFNKFLTGEIEADDELITILNPIDWSSLTLALINIRYGIECLCKEKLISTQQGFEIIKGLKKAGFRFRTKKLLFEICLKAGISEEIGNTLINSKFDIKKIDAYSCINNIKTLLR